MDAPWPCLTPPLKSESKSASLTKPTPSRISHFKYTTATPSVAGCAFRRRHRGRLRRLGQELAHDFLGEEWETPGDLAGGKRSDILFGPSPPICAKGNRLAQPFSTAGAMCG